MDFPVVLKIASDKILHKSDIGGVKVGIQSKEEAEAVYEEIIANAKKAHPDIVPNGVEVQKMMDSGIEVLVGMIRDAQFGPMIAFGMGGVLVNLLEDVSFKLAKGMTTEEITEQMEDTKVMGLLKGFRGEAPGDIDAVKSIEDTAITEKYFGPQYDIHGGGLDLIFPHHDSEIAQMEASDQVLFLKS